jgi:hypothetical protein
MSLLVVTSLPRTQWRRAAAPLQACSRSGVTQSINPQSVIRETVIVSGVPCSAVPWLRRSGCWTEDKTWQVISVQLGLTPYTSFLNFYSIFFFEHIRCCLKNICTELYIGFFQLQVMPKSASQNILSLFYRPWHEHNSYFTVLWASLMYSYYFLWTTKYILQVSSY